MAKKKSRARTDATQWDEFETRMAAARPRPSTSEARAPGKPRSSAQSSASEFDPAEEVVLQRLAQRSQLLRGRSEPLGNVVFLHGITGSDLSVAQNTGSLKGTWVDVPRLIFGHLSD